MPVRTTYAATDRTLRLLERAEANAPSMRASAGTSRFVLIHAPLKFMFDIIPAPIACGRTESHANLNLDRFPPPVLHNISIGYRRPTAYFHGV
jgi:hypothetical protein